MSPSEVASKLISLASAAKAARATDTGAGALKTLTAEETRLREFLHEQPPSVVFLLTAIMYLGRGDFSTKNEFLDYYADVRESFGSAMAAERQMLAKEPLAAYLQRGLAMLNGLGLNADNLV